ncbi:helix-turn-helix domain-containing protein [Undibacterium sp.]|uniref:helix-turn-helix domain-containing protein n=1 Tax=Undibacterium sp. TaxID=1914977 RepID=UPI00374DF8D0
MKEFKESPSSDINMRIAQRVASLRAEREMSLEALATRCNVSRSMISLIERGESSPTAVVLEKLAKGLGVTLASLFEDPREDASPLARRSEQLEWCDPQSGYLRRNVSPPHFRSPIQIVEVVFPAGASVAYEANPRDSAVQQQIWVLEGSMDISAGGQRYSLHAGDCLAMREDQAVHFNNPTDAAAHYVVVINSDF